MPWPGEHGTPDTLQDPAYWAKQEPFPYTWVAPSGVRVTSCKPRREDEWARNNWTYARRSYTNIVKVAFWQEPRRDLRMWLAKRGVDPALACRIAGHVYNHMTKICYCGSKKEKS